MDLLWDGGDAAYPSCVCGITLVIMGMRCQSIAAGMGSPSTGLPLWKTPGLSRPWAVIQQNQLGWRPGCSCPALGTLLSPVPSHPMHGRVTSPGCSRTEKQLPEELAEESGRESAPAGALAEAAEVVGKLPQEQSLGLRQGRGGQQRPGSLATLLQAWGLCIGGETGGER